MLSEPALRTPLCARLGIDLPIVQAPIGRVGCPALAAAVTSAGGLGMLGLSYRETATIAKDIEETIGLTDGRPFGVNLLLAWDQHERLAACLDAGARIVSFFWSEPERLGPYVDQAHAAGALVMHTIGSSDEARRATELGVDVIVAQGHDAGGHVWGSVGTLALVPVVVDAVSPVPVIAAGGIGDGRGLAAVLALGAQAAWMGTRFVLAEESLAHPEYRARVVEAAETDAVWSADVFDEGFHDAPVRTLDNSTLARWRDAGSPRPGQRPGEGEIVGYREDGTSVSRYSFAPPVVGVTGETEAMANFAGQSVGVVKKVQPAGEIVREVTDEARAVLSALAEEPSPRS